MGCHGRGKCKKSHHHHSSESSDSCSEKLKLSRFVPIPLPISPNGGFSISFVHTGNIAVGGTPITVTSANGVLVTTPPPLFDIANSFNPTTGIFTVPKSGRYQFSLFVQYLLTTAPANDEAPITFDESLETTVGGLIIPPTVTNFVLVNTFNGSAITSAGDNGPTGNAEASFALQLVAGETIGPVVLTHVNPMGNATPGTFDTVQVIFSIVQVQ